MSQPFPMASVVMTDIKLVILVAAFIFLLFVMGKALTNIGKSSVASAKSIRQDAWKKKGGKK